MLKINVFFMKIFLDMKMDLRLTGNNGTERSANSRKYDRTLLDRISRVSKLCKWRFLEQWIW